MTNPNPKINKNKRSQTCLVYTSCLNLGDFLAFLLFVAFHGKIVCGALMYLSSQHVQTLPSRLLVLILITNSEKKAILELGWVLITNGTPTNCLKYKGGSDEWFV